jgi:hypothetical protein
VKACEGFRTPTEHPNTARSLCNLAGLYRAIGAYAEAEPLRSIVATLGSLRFIPLLTFCGFSQAA